MGMLVDPDVIKDAADAGADIADSLNRLADAAEQLSTCGLTHNAIVTLLQHKTKLQRRVISDVLMALPNLRDYCSKRPPPPPRPTPSKPFKKG